MAAHEAGVTAAWLALALWLPAVPDGVVGRPLAVLGSLQDWRGVRFQASQFEQVRQYAADHWLEKPQESAQAWLAAANGALWTLTPTAELLPAAFVQERQDLPEDHGRYAGPAAPLQCGGRVLPGVLLHRVPPQAEKWRPAPGEAAAHAGVVQARKARLQAAWAAIPFDRKAFDCAMAWLEAEILRNGGGAVPLPGLGEDEARTAGGADFAWINAASAYLKALDPHSDLVARAFWERMSRPSTTAPSADVGLRLQADGAQVRVDDVVRDGPAWRAGVRVADVVERVDGEAVQGEALAAVQKSLTGAPGTKVKLALRRAGRRLQVTLVRRAQVTPDVEARLLDEDPTVGLLSVHDFVDHTAASARRAIERLRKAGGTTRRPKIRAWVLDLRDNGGGVLDEAVQLADLFLDHGPIVRVRKRDVPEAVLEAHPSDEDIRVPLVLLVGPGCASACEVLTAALRDHGRALVVGERTYGKASVQQLFRPFASPYLVKLTIARYYGPHGASLQAVGVAPDVEVPVRPGLAPSTHPREADLAGHLEATPNPPTDGNPLATPALQACLRAGTATAAWTRDPTPRTRPDYQTLVALDALRCLAKPP